VYAGKQSSSSPYSLICLEAYLHIFYRFCQSSKKQYIDPEDPMPPPEHNVNGPPTSVAPHLRIEVHINHIIQKPRWYNSGSPVVVGITFVSIPYYATVVN
jgi:hypothetical protein